MTLEQVWNNIVVFFSTFSWKLLTLVAVFVAGLIVIKIITMLLRVFLLKSPLENTLCSFIVSVSRFMLNVVLGLVLASILEVPIASLIAVLGALGLAVSLALQGSLGNLANGMMIIATKPFKEGDFVDIDNVSGNVKYIKMLTTEIITVDNKKIIMPNSKVSSSNIINYSSRPTRRVDLMFAVSYKSDIVKVKEILTSIVNSQEHIIFSPEPIIRLHEQAESSLKFCVKAWTATTSYWSVYWDLMEKVTLAFNEHGIEIPFNQLDVHIKDTNSEQNFTTCKGSATTSGKGNLSSTKADIDSDNLSSTKADVDSDKNSTAVKRDKENL